MGFFSLAFNQVLSSVGDDLLHNPRYAWLKTDLSKDICTQSLKSVNGTLEGDTYPYILADVIQLRILRWGDNFGLSSWALNLITGVLKRGGRGRLYTHREGQRRPCKDGSETYLEMPAMKIRVMWP